MKLARAAALALAACLLVSPFASVAANLYGHVEFVDGNATIVDADGRTRTARVGDTVREGETMVTGKDGELHARTDDHGMVALRADTRMKVEIYRANGDAGDTSVLSLVTGTLRSITGWIGKYNRNKYSIKTTVATIGVRGTDHEPMFIDARPGAAGPPGTYDKVNAGRTYIENTAGRVDVGEGRAGFAPRDAKSAPLVLDKVPEFYKPTRNEGRIRERKAQLEKEMEQRRLERQKERLLTLEKENAAAALAAKEKAAADKDKPATEKSDKAESADNKRDAPDASSDASKDDRKEEHKKARRHHPPKDTK